MALLSVLQVQDPGTESSSTGYYFSIIFLAGKVLCSYSLFLQSAT